MERTCPPGPLVPPGPLTWVRYLLLCGILSLPGILQLCSGLLVWSCWHRLTTSARQRVNQEMPPAGMQRSDPNLLGLRQLVKGRGGDADAGAG